jgi:fructose-1,6-bisphosphatase/sedoheptulose 1,7-bisphosphatase-like protein
VYKLEDLVAGSAFFAATGVTGGALLRAPRLHPGGVVTNSLVISERSLSVVEEHSIPHSQEVA